MKHLLISLSCATALFFAGSVIVVETVGNKDHGWDGASGAIFWFGFLTSAVLLAATAIAALIRGRLRRTAATITLLLLTLGSATVVVHSASSNNTSGTITFEVPTASVKAQGPATTAGSAAPDYFREAWTPKHALPVVRQDSVGFVEFDRGTFLGTITLTHGQIVYAGTTNDQDNFQYAILGGTGAYADARGTLTLRTVDQSHVRVTINLAS